LGVVISSVKHSSSDLLYCQCPTLILVRNWNLT